MAVRGGKNQLAKNEQSYTVIELRSLREFNAVALFVNQRDSGEASFKKII